VERPEHSPSVYDGRQPGEVSNVYLFVQTLGKEFAGGFSDRIWCDVLPRIAQHEAVVWDAVVAVSMLDTSIRLGQGASPAIHQYNKTIQALYQRLDSGENGRRCTQDVVLLACLLFTIFECLQNSTANALKHISGGMKLLMEWEADGRSGSSQAYLDREVLEPIFLMLDSQAVQMGAIGFPEFREAPTIHESPRQHVMFLNIDDAHLSLSRIFNRFCRWGRLNDFNASTNDRPYEEILLVESHSLDDQLHQWDLAFGSLNEPSSSQSTFLLLKFEREVFGIFFDKNKKLDGNSQTGWDEFNPQFLQAIKYAEAYMKTPAGSFPASAGVVSEHQRASFIVAMDLVMPLFLIGSKCRNGSIRRRALALLKQCDRREGIWDSQTCVEICKKIIELEEEATLSDGTIPEDVRVYGVDVTLCGDDDVSAEVVFRQRALDNS
jgi:hypothetical protein